ncbi:cuticle protein AM1274-like [Oratosquilla oratoria]|uniref:cuticle protein AM1274-like n=1 Tax=Oratosquilla oratoria TaxID=337810 RepID=UPI003F76E7B6
MARLIVLAALICAAAARPQFLSQPQFRNQQPQFVSEPRFIERPFIEIVRSDSTGPEADGSYSFSFEDSAGARRSESAQYTGPNLFFVEGSYSYPNEDGSVVEVRFRADENGYVAESPYLPVAPPMPAHALEQIRFAEEQKRQGVIFDEQGFIVGQRNNQVFNQGF